MKLFKKNHEHESASEQASPERIREESLWKNRMKSSKVFKMSQGAVNIFRVIKDRSKWGEKSFPKNKLKK